METKWCIFYSNGTFHSSEDGLETAPVIGIQLIAQEDPRKGWLILGELPFHIWDTRDGITRWWGASDSGRENYIRKPGYKIVLIGEWIGDETYQKIFEHVSELVQQVRKTGQVHWTAVELFNG